MGEALLQVAELHKLESNLTIDYRLGTAEELAQEKPAQYDIVTCLEMLEHVPDPASVIQACADLVKPGGHLYFATINRNPKSFLFAIVGAEYIMQMLPKGTHEYAKFIQPAEMAKWLRDAGLELNDISGMTYNPITRHYRIGKDTDVNYLLHATKPT